MPSCPNGPGPCYCTGHCHKPIPGDPLPPIDMPGPDPEIVKEFYRRERPALPLSLPNEEKLTIEVTLSRDLLREADLSVIAQIVADEAAALARKAVYTRFANEQVT